MAGKRITDLDKSNFEDRKADGFVAVANSDTSFKVPLSDFNAENLGAQEKLQPAGDSSTPVYINGESKAAAISDPIQPGLGGTGETTLKAACNGMINSLDTGDDTPGDNDYIISQYAGGSQAKYYRRKLSKLWDWLKSKISDKRITIKVNNTSNSFTLNQNKDAELAFITPSVPTVNNNTITIKANGKSGSFTLNQNTNGSIDLGSPSVTPGNGTLTIYGTGEKPNVSANLGSFTANQTTNKDITVSYKSVGGFLPSTKLNYTFSVDGKNNSICVLPYTLIISLTNKTDNSTKVTYLVASALNAVTEFGKNWKNFNSYAHGYIINNTGSKVNLTGFGVSHDQTWSNFDKEQICPFLAYFFPSTNNLNVYRMDL